jgi:hypothetical protein
MPDYDWEHSVYGNPTEDIPADASTPLGKQIILTHYFDVNLMHDVLYPERPLQVLFISITRLQLTGIVRNNLPQKRQHTDPNS